MASFSVLSALCRITVTPGNEDTTSLHPQGTRGVMTRGEVSPLGHSEGGGKPLVIFPFSHLHVSWEGIAVSGHRHSRLCQLLHREINSLNPPLN